MSQRVLLIDDSAAIHALVRVRLRDEPVSLHCALGGEEGLRMACEVQPDTILLDMDMPAPNGLDVCRRLKADPTLSHIPVIFLTGAAAITDMITGLELGAVDHVTKPFNPTELKARLRAALRTKYLMDLLARKGQIDGLSGLWNEAFFEDRLHQELSLSRRAEHPLACILLDIDRLGHINKQCGFWFGDEVIRRVAAVLGESMRAEDVICRFKGGRFGILCPNTTASGAAYLAERCRVQVAALGLKHHEMSVPVTCGIGVADNSLETTSLVAAAEKALRTAKTGGREQIIVGTPPPAVPVVAV